MDKDDIGRTFIGLPPEFLLPKNKLKTPKIKRSMLNKQKWTDTDMQEFAEWCCERFWIYFSEKKIWENCAMGYERKTTAQLLQEFKEWKEGQKCQ